MNYLFVLGRDPELSLLELECYFEARNIEYKFIEYTREIAVLSLPKLDFNKIMKDLGGTIKIAEIFSDSGNLSETEYELNKLQINPDKKMDYCISEYNSELKDFIKDLIKSRLKKERVKAVYRQPKRKTDRFLTPSELVHKKIIENGLDIVIYKNYIARTIALFNPFEIEERDMERPKKDFLKTTSLRLAKILINLSYAKDGNTLLDPFSGTGTILQEALLKNMNVIGIDLDKKSVDYTYENLDWLKREYNVKGTANVYNGDSRFLTKVVKTKIDAVVSEPFMGPFLKRQPSRQEAMSILNSLKLLYQDFLNEITLVLKKNGKIVLIMPGFEDFHIDPTTLADLRVYQPRIDIKLPIPYILKNSHLKRYIYVLELNSKV
ncbi:MAG: DNA methyltransferase [Candidatus Nanoarchaeia archaeon]|nr:DNA methyltransferase [Candidatus Nanoarchaeia archaeon]